MKSNEIEFQSEEESPGGKYTFVFNDLNRIHLKQGLGEVSLEMKDVRGLAVSSGMIAELKENSSGKIVGRLSSSAIRYLAVGVVIVIYSCNW